MSAGPAQKPNIVLVMTDQQRWDALAAAGTFPVRTPNLDRLVAEGTWFRRTYSQSPLCVPSRTSMLTGRYPHQHQCLDNDTSPWPEAPSFVRCLRDAGYRTANVGKLHYTWFHDVELLVSDPILRAMGFDDPFETTGKMSRGNLRASAYTEHLKARGLLDAFHADLLERASDGPLRSRASFLDEHDHIDGWVLGRAEQWLLNAPDEPFFLWVGPEGPHDPFDPPEPYASMYDPAGMPLGPLDYRYPVGASIASSDIPDATADEIRRMRAHYLANVTFIDAWLGRLLAALETRGLLDNTWVVFTSDHGDLLGDHRLVGKGQFFESSVRVPLIVRPPNAVPAGRGLVRDALVELIDVPATMLDLAGTALAGQRGRSLLRLLDDRADDLHREFVISEIDDRTMITDGETKVELGPGDRPIHAFDLVEDPDEEHDLAGTDASWIALLSKAASAYRVDTPADMPAPWHHLTPNAHWGRNPLREYGAGT
ncbi:sulfatase [Jiangella asiatica]|uniref:Sulfatase N-terminal domain-containing protein n=1 Tax=Jiangella asiatica TaxID=2530372 RepID=A0A4R5DH10_9ACTN|nr:sulfatase-like hydrolase/transferase [Jiangella asiatica]TDE11201.1 hypothetical protein E1269_10050 [Jiangella asiatica]